MDVKNKIMIPNNDDSADDFAIWRLILMMMDKLRMHKSTCKDLTLMMNYVEKMIKWWYATSKDHNFWYRPMIDENATWLEIYHQVHEKWMDTWSFFYQK